MPLYTLVYFNGRGRAEVARLLFAQAAVRYEDKRLEGDEWPKLKPTTKTGSLPYLKIDGYELPQSMAIARFLAREFSMYGVNNLEMAKVDVILDTMEELLVAGGRMRYGPDADKPKLYETLLEKAKSSFKLMSDLLRESGTGWLVGKKVSVADFAAYHYCSLLLQFGSMGDGQLTKVYDDATGLAQHSERVASLPNIKDWIKKRPVTDF